MGRFSEQEVAFLQGRRLGRLATSGASGKAHVVPVCYYLDTENDVIKIGGHLLGSRGQDRLYVRHLKVNPYAALVIDDVPDEQAWQPRGILIKGQVKLHAEGGEVLEPGFGPQWIEIVPGWSTAWGLETLNPIYAVPGEN